MFRANKEGIEFGEVTRGRSQTKEVTLGEWFGNPCAGTQPKTCVWKRARHISTSINCSSLPEWRRFPRCRTFSAGTWKDQDNQRQVKHPWMITFWKSWETGHTVSSIVPLSVSDFSLKGFDIQKYTACQPASFFTRQGVSYIVFRRQRIRRPHSLLKTWRRERSTPGQKGLRLPLPVCDSQIHASTRHPFSLFRWRPLWL